MSDSEGTHDPEVTSHVDAVKRRWSRLVAASRRGRIVSTKAALRRADRVPGLRGVARNIRGRSLLREMLDEERRVPFWGLGGAEASVPPEEERIAVRAVWAVEAYTAL